MAAKLSAENLDAARQILSHPIVKEIIDDLEQTAMNGAVNAKLTDTDTPAAYLAEIRAIRKFRSGLEFILSEAPATLARNKPQT